MSYTKKIMIKNIAFDIGGVLMSIANPARSC